MAKKNARKSGGAASIAIVDDVADDVGHEDHEFGSETTAPAAKPARKNKPKPEPQSNGNFAVGDIKKAAAFVNAIGGLDKAIAVLQILKVAKEVQ